MKSSGKRRRFRFTASFSLKVGTSYSSARWLSGITLRRPECRSLSPALVRAGNCGSNNEGNLCFWGKARAYVLAVMLATGRLCAQDDHSMAGMNMPGMGMVDMNLAGMFLMNLASGTSANPASWPMPMLMTHLGGWNTMFMGTAFLVDTQQSGPRGGDKLYSRIGSWPPPNIAWARTERSNRC